MRDDLIGPKLAQNLAGLDLYYVNTEKSFSSRDNLRRLVFEHVNSNQAFAQLQNKDINRFVFIDRKDPSVIHMTKQFIKEYKPAEADEVRVGDTNISKDETKILEMDANHESALNELVLILESFSQSGLDESKKPTSHGGSTTGSQQTTFHHTDTPPIRKNHDEKLDTHKNRNEGLTAGKVKSSEQKHYRKETERKEKEVEESKKLKDIQEKDENKKAEIKKKSIK